MLHTVFFWFEPAVRDAVKRRVVDFYLERTQEIDGVEQVFIGEPAGTPRDVVDNSYDLTTSQLFRDRAAADAWQTHPVHDELRELLLAGLTRAQVYDAVE